MNAEHIGGAVLASPGQLHRDPHQGALELRHDQRVHVDRVVALKMPRIVAKTVQDDRLQRVRGFFGGRSGRGGRRPSLPVEAVIERISHEAPSWPKPGELVKSSARLLGAPI